MEEMLREFGASEIVTFDMQAAAMEWLASNKPDLAVIDPRLNDGICTDVGEKLSADGVPFAVYSGAGIGDDDTAFARGVWMTKPTTPEMVKETLERLAT
jgi:two-component SAPR family response regulator